jgi:hypothetical protein
MKMHNPPHPGEVLKTLCLEPLNLTVTEADHIKGDVTIYLNLGFGIASSGCRCTEVVRELRYVN